MGTIIKFFDKQLAVLFDKVRLSSPIAYTLIIVVIFGGSALVENFSGLEEVAPWLFSAISNEVLQALVALLLSSRTKRHLEEPGDALGVQTFGIDHDD